MQYVVMLFILLMQLPAKAQVANQAKSLESAVMQFNQLNSTAAYQQVYAQFEQLYATDKKNWLIPYYAAMIQSRMCFLKMGDNDRLANTALLWIARAKSIELNDEIYCAESMANTAKMSVNPLMRWLTYEDKIRQPLQLAKRLNPNNPRIYLLEANIQQKLPSLFGGGCKSTKPLIQKAELCLNKQSIPTPMHPSWGNQALTELKKACPL